MTKDMEGLMFIAEQTTPDDYEIKNVQEHKDRGVFYLSFDACLQSFDILNRNNRRYKKDNVEKCINTDKKIQALLKDNAWFGEMDHPQLEYQNQKFTTERILNAKMERRSHKILRPRFTGNLLNATIETCSGTKYGKGFRDDIIQGLNPAFSARAIASMKLIDNIPTVLMKKLITYDWVLYPSHEEAHATSIPYGITKTADMLGQFKEAAEERWKQYSTDIFSSLRDILENIGHKDPNAAMIMESFELSEEDIFGFSRDNSHLVLEDGSNTIFAKISKESKDQVDDFFASF